MVRAIEVAVELELVQVVGPSGVASREADIDADVQEDRQVRQEPARREVLQAAHLLDVEAAPVPLVADGGVAVAVADDDPSGGEGGPDHLGDVLCALGREQERVRDRVEPASRPQDDLAHLLARPRAAGLPREDHVQPARAQPVGEEARLEGLPGAVGALEGDEADGMGGLGHGASLVGRGPRRIIVGPTCAGDDPRRPPRPDRIVSRCAGAAPR